MQLQKRRQSSQEGFGRMEQSALGQLLARKELMVPATGHRPPPRHDGKAMS
jgi:hypothetical protein